MFQTDTDDETIFLSSMTVRRNLSDQGNIIIQLVPVNPLYFGQGNL
jgi:hypothetical protein